MFDVPDSRYLAPAATPVETGEQNLAAPTPYAGETPASHSLGAEDPQSTSYDSGIEQDLRDHGAPDTTARGIAQVSLDAAASTDGGGDSNNEREQSTGSSDADPGTPAAETGGGTPPVKPPHGGDTTGFSGEDPENGDQEPQVPQPRSSDETYAPGEEDYLAGEPRRPSDRQPSVAPSDPVIPEQRWPGRDNPEDEYAAVRDAEDRLDEIRSEGGDEAVDAMLGDALEQATTEPDLNEEGPIVDRGEDDLEISQPAIPEGTAKIFNPRTRSWSGAERPRQPSPRQVSEDTFLRGAELSPRGTDVQGRQVSLSEVLPGGIGVVRGSETERPVAATNIYPGEFVQAPINPQTGEAGIVSITSPAHIQVASEAARRAAPSLGGPGATNHLFYCDPDVTEPTRFRLDEHGQGTLIAANIPTIPQYLPEGSTIYADPARGEVTVYHQGRRIFRGQAS